MTERERFLKGTSGNLYSTDSEAYHWALEQLRDHLVAIGFTVNKKARSERTLRVYPTRSREYPLLNPYFRSTAVQLGEIYDVECLFVRVLSRANDGSLDRQLGTFVSTQACSFHAFSPRATDKLHSRGAFILPIRFLGKPDKQEIDFAALRAPLAQIFAFLEGITGKNEPVPRQSPRRRSGCSERSPGCRSAPSSLPERNCPVLASTGHFRLVSLGQEVKGPTQLCFRGVTRMTATRATPLFTPAMGAEILNLVSRFAIRS